MGLIATFKDFLKTQEEMKKFNNLSIEEREIVFYAESSADWIYFEGIINSLISEYKKNVIYLTSEKSDPIFDKASANLIPFYIGDGTTRTILINTISCKMLIMTLPDLDRYNLKRSTNSVHYVYLFHSMVSTHMTLRYKAVDAYDTILMIGPHHLKEIRKHEEIENLSAKKLLPLGYHRLDKLIDEQRNNSITPRSIEEGIKVLIAPSWGDNSITNICAIQLIEKLLENKFEVIYRPHPMSKKTVPKIIDQIKNRFINEPRFIFEEDITQSNSLHTSHVMVSDWSGVALEYAFAIERPVLFIDLPRKVHNPHYHKLNIEPFEAQIRDQVGAIVSPDSFDTIGVEIKNLCTSKKYSKESLREIRNQWIYNVGKSGKVGAQHIINLLGEI